MLSDSLYASAFAVKKAKLWKKLSDTQLFAVRHSDSTISYCWVMGHTGQFYSLAFFLNESDLVSIDRIHRQDDQPLLPHEQLELFCLQDCMSVSFVNKAELRDRDFPEISAYCKANGIQPRGAHAAFYPVVSRRRDRSTPYAGRLKRRAGRRQKAGKRNAGSARLPVGLSLCAQPPAVDGDGKRLRLVFHSPETAVSARLSRRRDRRRAGLCPLKSGSNLQR